MIAVDPAVRYGKQATAWSTVLARAVQMDGAFARSTWPVIFAEQHTAAQPRLTVRELHHYGPDALVENDALQAFVKRKRVWKVARDVNCIRWVPAPIWIQSLEYIVPWQS